MPHFFNCIFTFIKYFMFIYMTTPECINLLPLIIVLINSDEGQRANYNVLDFGLISNALISST